MDEHGLDEQAAWRFLQTAAMNGREKIARDRAQRGSTAT